MAVVAEMEGSFRSYEAGRVQVARHSKGASIMDRDGNVTVLDVALIRQLHDAATRDHGDVIDAREVTGGAIEAPR